MTEKPLAMGELRRSVFLPAEARSDLHIVDQLIRERCPSFVGHWTWPLVRPLLYGLLNYRRARQMADHLSRLNGWQSFEYLSERLDFELQTRRFDRIPPAGRIIIAANHPTGLADGVAVWEALRSVREDIVFFANADAIRVNDRFADMVIPVEWVMEKRSPAKTRETLRLAADAFAAEKCVVIFPSGKLAKMQDGRLTEQPWFSTVIGLAKKQAAPVVPLHVDARNSKLYYTLSKLNGELRDITLFHELLNKRGATFAMTAGPVIAPDALQGPANAVTEALHQHVAYRLGEDPDTAFTGAG